ncbi:hypothetical protein AOLI_G00055000 [Acnodon oligacanthus]
MGIFQSSSVLCFVVDTSASMTEEIAEVKRITSFIIDSRRGTVDEPSAYVLVLFNDPAYFEIEKPDFESSEKGTSLENRWVLTRWACTGCPGSPDEASDRRCVTGNNQLRSLAYLRMKLGSCETFWRGSKRGTAQDPAA